MEDFNLKNIQHNRKGYEIAAVLAEINILISSSGLAYSLAAKDDSIALFSLLGLGINTGFLLYDTYQVWSLEKENSLTVPSSIQKVLVKKEVKSINQKKGNC